MNYVRPLKAILPNGYIKLLGEKPSKRGRVPEGDRLICSDNDGGSEIKCQATRWGLIQPVTYLKICVSDVATRLLLFKRYDKNG